MKRKKAARAAVVLLYSISVVIFTVVGQIPHDGWSAMWIALACGGGLSALTGLVILLCTFTGTESAKEKGGKAETSADKSHVSAASIKKTERFEGE